MRFVETNFNLKFPLDFFKKKHYMFKKDGILGTMKLLGSK